jgi:hypothetical protein
MYVCSISIFIFDTDQAQIYSSWKVILEGYPGVIEALTGAMEALAGAAMA